MASEIMIIYMNNQYFKQISKKYLKSVIKKVPDIT